jgi:TPR repeat protein
MASRKDLALIRSARANLPGAQLLLGKRYLFGGDGMPQNVQTALHWLHRAALQDEKQAWLLIGEHIPYEVLQQTPNPYDYQLWYERAFDAGSLQAAWVFAALVLAESAPEAEARLQHKALRALQIAAKAGRPEAQWLLAKHQHRADLAQEVTPDLEALYRESEAVQWAQKAADAGVEQAQYVLAEAAWMHADWDAFEQRALPMAQGLLVQYAPLIAQMHAPSAILTAQLGAQNHQLLSRLVQRLLKDGYADKQTILGALELLAYAQDRQSQLLLGTLLAHIDTPDIHPSYRSSPANYKKALRWLDYAAQLGDALAVYRMAEIYLKPGFSQRNAKDAEVYLLRAAEMGDAQAQYEAGARAWRHRKDRLEADVDALYWLQKAAVQQHAEAIALIDKIATVATPSAWAVDALAKLTHAMTIQAPLLCARIELAAVFGLSRPEALLIDLVAADKGHCLVVDIRAHYARSKRRIITISTGEERQHLARLTQVFEGIDAGPTGPEGNYRQRQYKLKTMLPDIA